MKNNIIEPLAKPCPKCGNTDTEWHIQLGYIMGCYECKFKIDKVFGRKDLAIEAWNKLSPP